MLHLWTLRPLAGTLLLAQMTGGWAWSQNETPAPEQILRRAGELQQAGDLEGAIEQYQVLLTQYPEAAEVRFGLGSTYAAMGNFRDAIPHFEQALQSGTLRDSSAARSILGWAYFQDAEFEKARDLLTETVREQPDNMEALQLLASSHLSLNENKKVIELLSPLESDLGRSPDLAFLLGTALIQDGQIERGGQLASTALQTRDSAEARLTLGRARMMRVDLMGAVQELERALELNPRLPTLNSTYGKLLRVMTREDEANQAFLRELEISPDDYDSNLFHGIYVYDSQQDYEEALACFQRALRARPDEPAVRFQIGLVYNSMNRLDEALRTVREVVEEYPDFLEGQVTLTRLYYRLGREEDAERHHHIAQGLRTNRDGQQLIQQRQFSRAVDLFDHQIKADPTDPRPYFYSGMALGQMGDWSGAAGQLAEAVRLDSANSRYTIAYANALSRSGQREAASVAVSSFDQARLNELEPALLWLLSETYHRTGRQTEALQVLDVLAQNDPDDARVDLLRGQIYLVQGDFERARGFAERSIEGQPTNNALAYSILGAARYQLGDKEGAKQVLLQAVDQDPDNADYLGKLGAVCLELGENQEAIKYLERARPGAGDSREIARLLERAYQVEKRLAEPETAAEELDATTRPEREAGKSVADQLVDRGEWALAAGKVRDAVKLFELAVEEDPGNWPARSFLADIFLSRGLLEQTYDHLSRMEAIDPGSPIGKHLMAQYWYQRRDYRRALDYAVQVKEVDSSNSELRNLLGNIYFSLGETQQAVGEYAAAVELDPERPELKMNLEVARKKLP